MSQLDSLEGVEQRDHTPTGQIHRFTKPEAEALFENRVRRHLDMTTQKFLTKWDRGDFEDCLDDLDVKTVAMLLPLVRES